MKLVYLSSFIASAVYAGPWGYDTQPWTSGYCKPADYVRQSPIDIVTKDLVKGDVDYDIDAANFVKDHFLEDGFDVTLNQIDSISAHSVTFSFVNEIGNDKFSCPQFHCHFADSEHSVDDKKTFGECHTVCYDKEKYGSFGNAVKTINGDELAVFGFFIEEEAHSAGSDAVDTWIEAYHGFDNTTEVTSVKIAVPENVEKYYRYMGGLTTPGCNPIVQWTVFADSVKISTAQKLEILSWSSGHLIGNNREVQPMQGREVTCFGCSDDDFEDDEEDDKNCANKMFVIREDGTIRPSEDESQCASVQMKGDDVRYKGKLTWLPCDSAEGFNLHWKFHDCENKENGYESHHDHAHGTISAEISDEYAWTVRNLKKSNNQVVPKSFAKLENSNF